MKKPDKPVLRKIQPQLPKTQEQQVMQMKDRPEAPVETAEFETKTVQLKEGRVQLKKTHRTSLTGTIEAPLRSAPEDQREEASPETESNEVTFNIAIPQRANVPEPDVPVDNVNQTESAVIQLKRSKKGSVKVEIESF